MEEAAASVLSHAFADHDLTFMYHEILRELHGNGPPDACPPASPPTSPPLSPVGEAPRPLPPFPPPPPLLQAPPPPALPTPPLLQPPLSRTRPPFMIMPLLPRKQPRIIREKAYAMAVDKLKYRCTRCTNPRFLNCGKCPFQWNGKIFVDRCRFYHTDEQRKEMPSKAAVEALVSVLMTHDVMWGK